MHSTRRSLCIHDTLLIFSSCSFSLPSCCPVQPSTVPHSLSSITLPNGRQKNPYPSQLPQKYPFHKRYPLPGQPLSFSERLTISQKQKTELALLSPLQPPEDLKKEFLPEVPLSLMPKMEKPSLPEIPTHHASLPPPSKF